MFEFKKPDFSKLKAELSKLKPDFTPVKQFLSKKLDADKWGLGYRDLNPLLDSYVTQLDATLQTPSVSGRIESLLALRGDTNTAFGALEKKENAITAGGLLITAGLLLGTGLFAAATVLGGIAMPLSAIVWAGASAVTGYAAYTGFRNREQVGLDRHTLTQQINAEVVKLAEAHPAEAAQSPLYKKSLRSDFANATAPYQAEAYKELRSRATPVEISAQAGTKKVREFSPV